MRTFAASLVVAGLALTQARPQGVLNGISNFLTSAFGGGGNAGEVDDYQNAPYEVIQTYDVSMSKNIRVVVTKSLYQGYEERFYPSRLWVCTRSDSDNGGFMKLFRYISGANTRSEIKMAFIYDTDFNCIHFRAED